jgi:hypothetical protein
MLLRRGRLRMVSVPRPKVQPRHHHQTQVLANLQQRDGGKRRRGHELVERATGARSEFAADVLQLTAMESVVTILLLLKAE